MTVRRRRAAAAVAFISNVADDKFIHPSILFTVVDVFALIAVGSS